MAETVELKNGTEEVISLVAATMLALERLLEERPLALYDLVMKCRDRNYQFFGSNGKHLQDLNLVDPNGTIHGSIRNVILSAVRGEGLDMAIGSPIKGM